jgi:FkbM family methyltransferase
MKHFLENAGRLLTSPKMAQRYAKWNWERLCRQPHERKISYNLRVRGFRNFSEYWSFTAPSTAEVAFLEGLARTAKTIIDIGANMGSFTLTMARLAPQARVYSFEPAPSTFRLLERNIKLNSLTNISPQMMVVCDRVGTVQFTDATHGAENNSLFRAAVQSDCPVVDVPGTTLDQFCRDQSIETLDFLKIDTEGAEPLVLRGATEMFRRKAIKVALMEIAANWLKTGGSSQVQLGHQVRELGYDLFHLNDDGTVGHRMTDDMLDKIVLANVVLLPNP